MDRSGQPVPGPDSRGRISRRHCLRALTAAGIAAATSLPRPAPAQDIRYFRIGTGPTGASYFPVGAMLASIISNPPGSRDCAAGGSCGVPGLIAVSQTSQGSVDNLEAMAAGQLDSGLSQADVAFWAYGGAGPFQSRAPMKSLRAIASLYLESLHVVVRRDAGIRSVAQLRGKRVSLGAQGSGTLITARQVLAAYKLGEKLVKPSYLSAATAAEQMRAGQLDAFFQVAGAPVPAIADLALATPVDMLPFEDDTAARLRASYPFLAIDLIASTTYVGIADTVTLGIAALWLTTEAADEELIYGITKALWHPSTRKVLDQTPIGRQIRFDTATANLPLPVHAGAARYYAEVEQKQSDEAQKQQAPQPASQ
ncbi:MAG: TAXI family TRAP transporter solute-binding subunit [Dongiaceae bacterium]